MPRTKPAEERRADLLAAAREVFVAKGVTAATLEDITKAAGVSKGLFWQYFHSKEDLVFVLRQQYAQQFAEVVRAATQPVTDWAVKLDTCVQACLDQYQNELDLHDVLFRHTTSQTPDQRPAHAALVDVLVSILSEGATAGAYLIDIPEMTANLLFGAMQAFDPAFRGGGELSAAEIRATQQLFRRAVGITEPPTTDCAPAASAALTAGGGPRMH
ncbi:TetR/AcrR family transcriptional regulator [Nocardia sp. CA-107356]|uniref:TetR/AcrR family transcriptional regulator n=1 Tax=Nocardia sp. CA-107356 TaxID=3239972 RepID=UPI003D906577